MWADEHRLHSISIAISTPPPEFWMDATYLTSSACNSVLPRTSIRGPMNGDEHCLVQRICLTEVIACEIRPNHSGISDSTRHWWTCTRERDSDWAIDRLVRVQSQRLCMFTLFSSFKRFRLSCRFLSAGIHRKRVCTNVTHFYLFFYFLY